MSTMATEEAHVTHGTAWVFVDGKKYRSTSVDEYVDRIEFMGRDDVMRVGTIIRKHGSSAWLVDFHPEIDGDHSRSESRVQHVAGCGCSGAPRVDWEG